MRLHAVTFCLVLVALTAATAEAQYGLYGSPETLNFAQPNPAMAAPGPYAQVGTYPAAQQPTYQPMVAAGPYAAAPTDPGLGSNMDAGGTTPPPPAAPPMPVGHPIGMSGAAPNAVGQMLTASDNYTPQACGGGADSCGPIMQAVNDYESAACGGSADSCAVEACNPWYVSLYALGLTRNQPNRLWLSYEWGNEANQLTNAGGGMRWRMGSEVRFGRRFCCNQWGIEARYWTVEAFGKFQSTTHPNNLGTPLTVGWVEYAGAAATGWFDNAAAHRIWRHNEFHNVELNLLRYGMPMPTAAPWSCDWLVGLRYFRFEEGLTFASLTNGGTWGVGADEAFIDEQVTNDLFGAQIGFEVNRHVGHGCRLFFAPQVGIYNNHIDQYFNTYLGDGTIGAPSAGSGETGSYPIRSSTDALAFLTQVDVGLQWDFAQNWNARVGYRVMVMTGIGLADNQIPQDIVDIPELTDIDINGELIIHGGFAGLTYSF